jgi:hypothetical protein
VALIFGIFPPCISAFSFASTNRLLPNVFEQMDGFSKVSNFLTETLLVMNNLRWVKQISHFTDSFSTVLNMFCEASEFHISFILLLFMFPLSWLLHKQ